MGNRKKREPGPQHHAEGQHGAQTHKRFIEMLQEGRTIGSNEVKSTGKAGDDVLADARIPHEGDSV